MVRIKICPKCMDKEKVTLTFIVPAMTLMQGVPVLGDNGNYELDLMDRAIDFGDALDPKVFVKCNCGHTCQVKNLFELEK